MRLTYKAANTDVLLVVVSLHPKSGERRRPEIRLCSQVAYLWGDLIIGKLMECPLSANTSSTQLNTFIYFKVFK